MRGLSLYTATVLSLSVLLRATWAYRVELVSKDDKPVLSYVDGSSEFQQVFNPSWVQASTADGSVQPGLLVRTQNCSASVGGSCVKCSGSGGAASVITFTRQNADGSFSKITAGSVVFSPSDDLEKYGTEDPRLAYDDATGLYHLFYTCYGVKSTAPANDNSVLLCQATTTNPTIASQWTRYGPVFPLQQNSKSAALWLRPLNTSTSHLIWGAGEIRFANTTNLTEWDSMGDVWLQARDGHFDDTGVEAGPPPMRLSDGNWLFFYNSWNQSQAYHPGYVILDGRAPGRILQRSDASILSPDVAWTEGIAPYTCNVPNVVFLEAAHPVAGAVDTFDVYFGGADATVGTARFKVDAS